MNRKSSRILSFFIALTLIVSSLWGILSPNVIADAGVSVTSIAVSVKAPVVRDFCYVEDFEVTPSAAGSVTVVSAEWYDATDKIIIDDDYRFVFDHKYCLCVVLKPNDGYSFEFDNGNNYTGTATCNSIAVTEANSSSTVRSNLYLMSAEFTPELINLSLVGIEGSLPSPDLTGSTSQYTTSYNTMENPFDYSSSEIYWYDVTADEPLSEYDYFIDGHDYVLQAYLVPKGNYTITYDSSDNYVGEAKCLGEAPAVARRVEQDSVVLYMESVVFTAHMSPITTINITNLPRVYAGDFATTEGIKIETDPKDGRSTAGMSWYDLTAQETLSPYDMFEENHEYVLRVELCANYGHYFRYDDSFNFLDEAFFDGEEAALAVHKSKVDYCYLYDSMAIESSPIKAVVPTPITEVDIAYDMIPADGIACVGPSVTITTNPADTAALSTAYTNESVFWLNASGTVLDEEDFFEYGEEYYLVTALESKNGYTFKIDPNTYMYTGTATYNGEPSYIAGRDYSMASILLVYTNPIRALYAVNVEIEGGDSTCSASASVTAADIGDFVSLTATAGEEYVFVGWECNEVDASSGTFNMPKSSVTVTAVFEKITYDVTFEMNGHGTAVAPQTVEHGSTASEPSAPSEDGWTFDGWYQDSGLNTAYDFATPVTKDTVVYAKWTEITYALAAEDIETKVWILGSSEALNYTIHRSENDDQTYNNLVSVSCGPKTAMPAAFTTLSTSDMRTQTGSLKLSILPSFLNTLEVGTYTLKVNFVDGFVTFDFEIKAADPTPTPSPSPTPNPDPTNIPTPTPTNSPDPKTNPQGNTTQTGEALSWMPIAGGVLVAGAVALSLISLRKRNKN